MKFHASSAAEPSLDFLNLSCLKLDLIIDLRSYNQLESYNENLTKLTQSWAGQITKVFHRPPIVAIKILLSLIS